MKKTIASLKGANTMGLRAITVGGLLVASFGLCLAEEVKQENKIAKEAELAPTTVIANRVEMDLDKVGSSVSILNTKELDRQGVRQLDDALKFVPGVISDTSSGQRGTTTSLFIRGNDSKYTGFLLDGIRMDNSVFHPGNFLGSGNMLGLSNIEILKGPQGVLYGASSMSGVLGMSQAKGEGPFSGRLRVEGGSFNSWNTMLGIQGTSGSLAYSLSLGHELTDNDLPNNDLKATSYAIRLDYDVNDDFRLGATFRGIKSDLTLPNYANHSLKASDIDFTYSLATAFAEYDVNELWKTKLTLGLYNEVYRYTPVRGSISQADSDKFSTLWDNTLTWNENHTTVAGFAYEELKYQDNRNLKVQRQQYAFFVNHVWDINEQWSVSGGLRWENYSDNTNNGFNGNSTTWRAASAYTVERSNTIIRGSIGTGFQLPTFYQVYNNGLFNQLDPAKSIGWDIGIEQPFYDGQYKLGVTYFATRTENTIDYIRWNSGAIYENRPNVNETSGIEVSAKGSFFDERINATIAYTWLDRQSLRTPHFLAENTLSARIDAKVSDKLNLGLTSTYQGHRALYGNRLDDYALVNIYANYKLSDNISLNARVDNLLDKEYDYGVTPASRFSGEQVRPGRGVGYFAGVTLSW